MQHPLGTSVPLQLLEHAVRLGLSVGFRIYIAPPDMCAVAGVHVGSHLVQVGHVSVHLPQVRGSGIETHIQTHVLSRFMWEANQYQSVA